MFLRALLGLDSQPPARARSAAFHALRLARAPRLHARRVTLLRPHPPFRPFPAAVGREPARHVVVRRHRLRGRHVRLQLIVRLRQRRAGQRHAGHPHRAHAAGTLHRG